VSGFLHSWQSTNSFTYCSTFSFTFAEFRRAFRISLSFSRRPGVASSFIRYFAKCSRGRLMWEAIAAMFVIIVFFPATWPLTFGISKRSPLPLTVFTSL